jgi:hypothetical protein
MQISQEVRDYAAGKGEQVTDKTLTQGMEEKASEFRETGSSVYNDA